ncbi:hypothetical protein KC711_00245 [Candidatus Peregrinibacteria bacterium]|nr:hypothetical protein [Candidatus Peregrinibacteria bacterium]MCB9804713.1 hypothetical protein [Candidatus Peribacteria bacterium]
MPKQEPTPVINPKPAPDIVEPGQKTPDSILGENAYGNNVQRRIKNTLKEVKNP